MSEQEKTEIIAAAHEWATARKACLQMPVTPVSYDRLANAEAALQRAVLQDRGK